MTFDNSDEQPVWQPSEGQPGSDTMPPGAEPTTSADRLALIAITVSVTVVLSCIPFFNCLAPLAPLIIGGIALSKAKQAANPDRARTYGWIATGIGIVIVIVVIIGIIAYGAMFMTMFNEMENQMR